MTDDDDRGTSRRQRYDAKAEIPILDRAGYAYMDSDWLITLHLLRLLLVRALFMIPNIVVIFGRRE